MFHIRFCYFYINLYGVRLVRVAKSSTRIYREQMKIACRPCHVHLDTIGMIGRVLMVTSNAQGLKVIVGAYQRLIGYCCIV